jgi:uncharacterized protein (AIM24 family)
MQTTLAQYNETQSTDSFALQNSKLLKVRLDQVTIQAKLGSMVAYQGDVSFEHAGSGGLGRMLKKAVTGEGQSLMKMTGTGEVFLADTAQDIHLIYLENDKITVNGPNLLAFDSGIDWDIERLQGASGMMGGGLYNTSLQGTGWVAILSDGPPVLLNVAQAPDVRRRAGGDHVVVGVSTSIKTDFKMKNLVGRGSGESVQMAFQGQGWVLVQPSRGASPRPTYSRARAAAAGWGTCSTADTGSPLASLGIVLGRCRSMRAARSAERRTSSAESGPCCSCVSCPKDARASASSSAR